MACRALYLLADAVSSVVSALALQAVFGDGVEDRTIVRDVLAIVVLQVLLCSAVRDDKLTGSVA